LRLNISVITINHSSIPGRGKNVSGALLRSVQTNCGASLRGEGRGEGNWGAKLTSPSIDEVENE
jgi:hypothetical protein